MLLYQSNEIESVYAHLVKMLKNKSNPLLHGSNVSNSSS